MVHLIHRESWQSALSIYESRAEVTSFCLELSKKLDMRYESLAIRVDLMTPPTGENVHHQKEQLDTDTTNTDLNIRSNVEIDHNNHDAISVPSISLNNNIESNVYHELIMMYNSNNGSGSTTGNHNDTTTSFNAATTTTNHTSSVYYLT